MKNKKLLMIITLVVSLSLYGCSNNTTSTSDENKNNSTLKIFTTIFPIQDFTKKIGGIHVDVENVYPANADAHSFEPTTKTMTEIADADALIYNGAGIEGFVDASIEVLKDEKVTFVKASEGIDMLSNDHDAVETAHEEDHSHEHEEAGEDDHHSHDEEAVHEEDQHSHDDEAAHEEKEQHFHSEDEDHHDHGDVDPHVWLDPNHAITIAENIKDALIELKPEAKEEFEENYLSLKSELETLDSEFDDMVKDAANQEILVAHAAYGYWEKRYGIEQIAISGLSPTQEPSQKQLKEIIELAQEHKLNYIILEKNTPTKIANVVKNEIGAEALNLSNLESITEEDIENKEDYFSLMRKNIKTLKTALN